jgi:hypothetical protein
MHWLRFVIAKAQRYPKENNNLSTKSFRHCFEKN